MQRRNRFVWLLAVMLALSSVSCSLGPIGVLPSSPTADHTATPIPAASATPTPVDNRFGPVTIAARVDAANHPLEATSAFAGGTQTVFAAFDFKGVNPGSAWRREWLRDGQVLESVNDVWQGEQAGALVFALSDRVALRGGNYTFNLYLEGRLVQQATFRVAPLPATFQKRLSEGTLGEIIFCESVSDGGEPINRATTFPAGTTKVSAFFTVNQMVAGQSWGRLWEKDGQVYLDERNDAWQDESDTWEDYAIQDENGLAPGHYTLTLFIGDQAVQQASFDVQPPSDRSPTQAAAFGPITFGSAVNDSNEAVDPSDEFEYGIKEVFASFVYLNMPPGQAWSREWLRDGAVDARKDVQWSEGQDGVSEASLSSDDPLTPGAYTFNLYIDGQLARGARFVIQPAPAPQATPTPAPARPEQLIATNLLPAWRKLANAHSSTLRRLAQFVLDERIYIEFGNTHGGLAAYSYSSKMCRTVPGTVYVDLAYWSRSSWDEVASALAHELTHAVHKLSGANGCYCSVEDEYGAFVTEIYALQDFGRTDLIRKEFSFAFDRNGRYSQALLWQRIKKVYSNCKLR